MNDQEELKNLPREADVESDDEAPEEVTKLNAKDQALELLRHEKEARTSAAANKRKRTTRSSATESKAVEEAVEELPEDILSAVAAHHEEEKVEQELEAARERAAKKRLTAALKKKTHIRQFGNIQVQTVDDLAAQQTRKLTASTEEFLARKNAPQRARMSVLEGHASLFSKKQKQKAQRA
ncbi:hypothetical protein FI667_g12288, partial [Globisporangium splendens]